MPTKPDNQRPKEAARIILQLRPQCWITIRRAQVILGQTIGGLPSRDYVVDFILTNKAGPRLLEAALKSDIEVSSKYLPRGNRFTKGKR